MANRIILIAEGEAAYDGGFAELRDKLGCDKLEEGLANLFQKWREED
jgi:ABC-type uncharacterized transport system ATPase subunit